MEFENMDFQYIDILCLILNQIIRFGWNFQSILTIWRWKYLDILSNRSAEHKEVLIQIRSVHRKFLRVPKSYDYSG